jgi:hypothetical protein
MTTGNSVIRTATFTLKETSKSADLKHSEVEIRHENELHLKKTAPVPERCRTLHTQLPTPMAARVLVPLACMALHFSTLLAISLRNHAPSTSTGQNNVPPLVTKLSGLAAGVPTFYLPYQYPLDQRLLQAVLRVVSFFYGCKILDLAMCRSDTTPQLVEAAANDKKGRAIADSGNLKLHANYAWLLFTQMRYGSFDIAVKQRDRPPLSQQTHSVGRPTVVLVCLSASSYWMPVAELHCVCLLLLLQISFETLHTTIHPRCGRPVFYRPFAATSMSDFWSTHWHACANPFLHSLGYRPGRKLVGRWFGVLNTFNLTGIWHGWCVAGLVGGFDEALVMGFQMWAFFMMMGLIILAERWIWEEKQGGMGQRLIVWGLPILVAGQCLRTLRQQTDVPGLRYSGSF